MMPYRLQASVLVAMVGCGGSPPVENPSPFDEDDPAAFEDGEPPAPAASADAAGPPPREEPLDDTVARVDLERVLAAGPGAYRDAIAVEAELEGEQLLGWRIVRWDVGWPALRPGDVVLDINGVAVARPDDLETLWDTLRAADEIALRIVRDGIETTLAFPVVP
jgi:S1-C subfamily serine protease